MVQADASRWDHGAIVGYGPKLIGVFEFEGSPDLSRTGRLAQGDIRRRKWTALDEPLSETAF